MFQKLISHLSLVYLFIVLHLQ